MNTVQRQQPVIIDANKPYTKAFRYIWRNRFLYLIFAFPLAYCIIFNYIPIYGVIIAFEDYVPGRSFLGSPWVGLHNFDIAFHSIPFINAFKNTIIISVYRLIFGFPVPVILALLLNEVRKTGFKRVIQTLAYFPYFVSWVIIGGILVGLLSVDNGFVNELIKKLGMEPVPFMSDPKYFRAVVVISGIWKEAGWGAIIYLASLAAIDIQLYEAAIIDGANRWQQTIYVTLPGISSTIAIVFILSVSNIMNAGFDQIFVLLNPMVTDVGEIIDTYVYKLGIQEAQYGLATAVGLFKGIVSFLLLTTMNQLSKKLRGESVY